MIWTKNRFIRTKIPNIKDIAFIKALQKVEPKSMTLGQLPIVWHKAKGHNIWDRHGNKFIDFSSCIFVANAGHSNPAICKALIKQIKSNLLHTYSFATEIRNKAITTLCKVTGFEQAFLMSSGTEATEAACKAMRLSTDKKYILSFEGSMHGKTGLASNLKGDRSWCYNDNLMVLEYPKDDGLDLLRFLEQIKLIENDIAGIIIESYRGWDANFLPKTAIQLILNYCKSKNILICFDEIQAGIGRTGKLFAYDWYDLSFEPDLVCVGKGVGGGVPISALLGSKKILDSVKDFSSTNSGNPLVCAGMKANLDYLTKYDVIGNIHRKNEIMVSYLIVIATTFNLKVNYKGLVGAIIFSNEKLATKVCYNALSKGLIVVHTGRESIKIGPPLTISDSALKEGMEVLFKAIKEEMERNNAN